MSAAGSPELVIAGVQVVQVVTDQVRLRLLAELLIELTREVVGAEVAEGLAVDVLPLDELLSGDGSHLQVALVAEDVLVEILQLLDLPADGVRIAAHLVVEFLHGAFSASQPLLKGLRVGLKALQDVLVAVELSHASFGVLRHCIVAGLQSCLALLEFVADLGAELGSPVLKEGLRSVNSKEYWLLVC